MASDHEGEEENGTAIERIKHAKAKRAVAKRKFTRKHKLFKETTEDEDAIAILKDIYREVSEAYANVEHWNEKYVLLLTEEEASEELFDAADEYITEIEKMKIEVQYLFKKLDEIKIEGEKMVKVKALQPPTFDGDIRKYPGFKSDYDRLMLKNYGKDSYALRSCLTGEALEIVKGVESDFDEMFKRLDEKYADNRKLVDVVINELKNIRPINEGDSKGFINLANKVERCWLDLKGMNLEKEMNTASMCSYIEKVMPSTQKRDWVTIAEKNRNSKDLFILLKDFLLNEKRVQVYLNSDLRSNNMNTKGACNNAVSTINENGDKALLAAIQKLTDNQLELTQNFKNLSVTVGNIDKVGPRENFRDSNVRCLLHEFASHNIDNCYDFKQLSNEEKMEVVKRKRACFICLMGNHAAKYCRNRKPCNVKNGDRVCTRHHHPVLHEVFSERPMSYVSNSLMFNNQDTYNQRLNVLLMVSMVYSKGQGITTLWDPGSDVTMITFSAAAKLGLRGRDISLSVTKLGNKTETINSKEYVVPLKDRDGNLWSITAYGISEITSPVGKVDVSKVVNLFRNIKLSELERPSGEIELLVGSDWCPLMPQVQQSVGKLQLMDNKFGLCLRGSHPLLKFSGDNGYNASKMVNHVSCRPNLEPINVEESLYNKTDIAKFFEIESLGTHCSPRCGGCKCGSCAEGNKDFTLKEERELAQISEGLTYQKEKKRWSVRYAWIKDPKELPNNVAVAVAMMKSTEKKLKGLGPVYTNLYNEGIEDMINRKVARKLSISEINNYKGPVFYLHHHEILKPESESTPLRIVFNSSLNYKGHKLNDYWAKGPDMLNELLGILIRFRQGLIAVAGDLSKMYNAVELELLEQHTHRFVWRGGNEGKAPEHYALSALGFGDRPSGIIAMLALRKTAEIKEEEFPEVKRVIERNTYVDDIVHSVDSKVEAEKLMHDINSVLDEGSFKIKHWIMSGNDTPNEMLNLSTANEEKVLGLNWDPNKDVFSFKIKLNFSKKHKKVREKPNLSRSELDDKLPISLTRREVYSQVNAIYDPLGLIVPFTLGAKILMRELIDSKNDHSVNDWDEPMSEYMRMKWKNLFLEMFELEKISFCRRVKSVNYIGSPTLVIFSDASMLAYGACAYVRWKLSNGHFETHLLLAKNRIAPTKQLTMPRLEMCGAVVASRIRSTVEKHCDWKFDRVVHITDSAIVRAQIQKESYGFGTFIANRVAEIQSRSNPNEWYWTNSCNNPADMTTRFCHPRLLHGNSMWQEGPDFLKEPFERWPLSQDCNMDLPDVIQKRSTCLLNNDSKQNSFVVDISRFSSYHKLLRVVARVAAAYNGKSLKAISLNPSSEMLDKAEEYLVKVEQNSLDANWKVKYKRLGPSLNNGILFVGERIASWLKENWNRDRFILMPNDSKLIRLYIQNLHEVDHGGIESTLSKLQSKFWVIGARKIIKSVKLRCVTCKKLNLETVQQSMGQMIPERLRPSPPFYSTSCDLFGPISIRDTVKRRTFGKAYGIIFTCIVTRAVYLDLSESYDTKGFLAAFRRFAMIRGYPKNMYSDQGTQIVSASKELKNAMPDLNLNEISDCSNRYGTNWNFNKSANAPWQNGCSEALIKSVKRSLQIVIGDSRFTFSEMQTVLFEVANLLNERPIGIKPGQDIELGTYLCPNDLLLGRANVKALV